MHRYIVLLRGVMPTGKNKVPMARLREVMAQAGYQNPRTWIQSGNLLVDTEESAGETAQKVRGLIVEHIGPDLVVCVRTPEDIRQALAQCPFSGTLDLARVFYGFFESPPDAAVRERLLAGDWGDNQLALTRLCAYMYIPGNYTKARLNAGALEKLGGIPVTMRNRNTLNKLVALSQEG